MIESGHLHPFYAKFYTTLEDRVPGFSEKEPLQKFRSFSARTASLELKAWLLWLIRVSKVPPDAEEVTNKIWCVLE